MKTNTENARKVKQPSRKHEILTWAERQRVKIMSDRAVLMALARRANSDGECHPSHATIALDIHGSVDTVQRALKRLMLAGLVSRQLRNGKGGHRTSNLYTLSCPPKPHDAVQAKAAPKPHDAGDHFVELQVKEDSWRDSEGSSGSEVKEEEVGGYTHERTHTRLPVPSNDALGEWPVDWPEAWHLAPPAWMNRSAGEVLA
jgi:hypothetical protein